MLLLGSVNATCSLPQKGRQVRKSLNTSISASKHLVCCPLVCVLLRERILGLCDTAGLAQLDESVLPVLLLVYAHLFFDLFSNEAEANGLQLRFTDFVLRFQ